MDLALDGVQLFLLAPARVSSLVLFFARAVPRILVVVIFAGASVILACASQLERARARVSANAKARTVTRTRTRTGAGTSVARGFGTTARAVLEDLCQGGPPGRGDCGGDCDGDRDAHQD